MDIAKFRDMFLVEAADHLQQMTTVLMELEADPDNRSAVDALFRNAHSIKGMAGTMNFSQTASLAHCLEDILDESRQTGRMPRSAIDRVLKGVDLLEDLLDDIQNGRDERPVADFVNQETLVEEDPPAREEPQVRIDLGDSERLVKMVLGDSVAAPGPRMLVLLKKLAQLGSIVEAIPAEEHLLAGGDVARELLVRMRTELTPDEINDQLQKYSEIKEISFPDKGPEPPGEQPKKPGKGPTVRVSTDLLDSFINLTGELITTRYHLQNAVKQRHWEEVDEGVGQLTRLVKNLQHQVLQVRMLSLDNLFIRLARTVRDLARTSAKEVKLHLEGADIELDRAIVEELSDPLIHMVRNAIDHGISQQGQVSVRAWRERDQVMIEVADDGRGVDPEAVRKRALEQGLISELQAQSFSDYDLLQLICLPGFSTARTITATSGRGVGMDVVKTAVEKIGGLLEIHSQPGQGTRFVMKLPLSLAIIRVLLVKAAEVTLALPISRIVQTIEIAREQIQSSGRQRVIAFQGKLLPLLSLRKILNYPRGKLSDPLTVVATEVLGRRVGLVVDGLVGQREVFVQRLPAPFDELKGCSGATMLGDGQIVFVLDLQSLLEKLRG